ncbi:hypothetical protein [Altericista sp. CCNU0014]|uniref:hypothetical protein n=1 Tax=Altericista sp. CCNU0014 TaxID=3082949 RepID=UPI00385118B1
MGLEIHISTEPSAIASFNQALPLGNAIALAMGAGDRIVLVELWRAIALEHSQNTCLLGHKIST